MLFQRSGDVGVGIPFNIASYGMLTHILAKHCNLEADRLIHFIGDAHIYENHIEPLKKQIIRPSYTMPIIQINKKNNIDDYEFNDIKIKNYKYHPTIKMDMIA
jgi:thymidylate synthase